MANAHKDAKGWRIGYTDPNGDRRSLRPGKGTNKATANQIARQVDVLVAAKASGSTVELATAKWLGDIGESLHKKLVRARLTEPRIVAEPDPEPERSITLAAFLHDHMTHGRTSKGNKAAPATIMKWKPTQTFLNRIFPDRVLNEITAEDAHQFRVWLDNRRIKQKTAGRRGQPMTENAKRRHIATCKLFFNAAKRRGLVAVNPFEAQVSGSQPNRSRDFYVTPKHTAILLNAAPDTQWCLLIALWRLAGLRKMEVFNPTWGDVLWDQGKLRVRSTKTEHIEGCEIRYVPLRDIRQFLEDAFQAALPKGKRSLPPDTPVITRYDESNSNLDKPLRKIIEAAGLVPWPKLFQNLRASCETQWLKDGERADLVANWIGHSVTVQRKNYVQHTDEDVDAFNAKPVFKSGIPGGTQPTRIDANARETANKVMPSKDNENADEQRFPTSNGHGTNNPTRT